MPKDPNKLHSYVEDYRNKGYSIIRNVFNMDEVAEMAKAIDLVKREGLQYKSSFRHQNLLYIIQKDRSLGKILRFCQWPSYTNKTMAKYRTDKRFLELLEPLLGPNIKQIINQIIWKTPGSDQTSYGYHQDARFRRPESAYRQLGDSFVQVALAIDPHHEENGCLVFIEGSHTLGNLKYFTNKSVYQEDISEEVLETLEITEMPKVYVRLKPGDVAIWHPFLLHGSPPNRSNVDRRTYLNGFVKAENCDRGEWAFREGIPQELGDPQLVQFEKLYEQPEPHYLDGTPY